MRDHEELPGASRSRHQVHEGVTEMVVTVRCAVG
jgi:hypothetical protein